MIWHCSKVSSTNCKFPAENQVRDTFHCIAARAAIYRSLRTFRARNRKKVSKKVFLGVRRKVSKKYLEKSKNTYFRTFLGILRLFRVFFETFLRTPQKDLFGDLFAISGPEGPETPVNGGSGRKSCNCFARILSPKKCRTRSFGLQLTCFPRSPDPPTTRRKFLKALRELLS